MVKKHSDNIKRVDINQGQRAVDLAEGFCYVCRAFKGRGMEIEKLVISDYETNCYVVRGDSDSRDCFLLIFYVFKPHPCLFYPCLHI